MRTAAWAAMARTYAVIGDPVGHSLSPAIHGAAFRELGMDCAYVAYRVGRDELEAGIAALEGIGAAGFNVTIPHKVAIMGHLDSADEACSAIGAANTVRAGGGRLAGHNTDMEGFLDPLRRRGFGLAGARVLLLGAGGAARAVVAALAREGAARVDVANRTAGRAAALCGFASGLGLEARAAGPPGEAGGHDVIVNATPAGTGGGPGPLPASAIPEGSLVYDIVYSPARTDLIRKARERGAAVVYGYEMLLGQACRSFEIWHGRKAPYDAMRRAVLGGP